MEINRFDLENERKKVRSILRTPEGLEALRLETGLPIFTQQEHDALPKVAVLVPCHQQLQPETAEAVLALRRGSQGICNFVDLPSLGSSVVHWVRNDLWKMLLNSKKEYDGTLWMDDDIVPQADSLVRLLSHGKDIVAGACTTRQDPPKPNFRDFRREDFKFYDADWKGEPDGLLEKAVGTGFMWVSKHAQEAVAEYYLSCKYEVDHCGMSLEHAKKVSAGRRESFKRTNNAWWFRFLPQPHGDGEFGEDISFCLAAMEMGIQPYVDTTVRPGHVGRYPYSINDYLAQYDEKQRMVEFNVPKVEERMVVLA